MLSTTIVLTAEACRPPRWERKLSKTSISSRRAAPVSTNTSASALPAASSVRSETSAPSSSEPGRRPTPRASVRLVAALYSSFADSRPGVSMTVMSSSAALDSSTSTRSRSAGSAPRAAGRRCPRSRASLRLDPPRNTSWAWGGYPKRNQVTARVHSPKAVGATLWRRSAFTSVDLPLLTRPATATRSGSERLLRTALTATRTGSLSSACSAPSQSATTREQHPAGSPVNSRLRARRAARTTPRAARRSERVTPG